MGRRESKKPAPEFIRMAEEGSSDDDLAAILGNKDDSDLDPIGLDKDYSDDGEGLYSDDDDDEEDIDEDEEGDEEGDEEDEEGVEGEEGEEVDGEDGIEESEGDDEDEDDEDEEGEFDDEEDMGSEMDNSEFDDGDINDLAGEDDLDESDEDEMVQPVAKKPKGLGTLARKLAALEEEIADIESKQIDQKHWTLTGEVAGKARPLNSILEADLELPFGHMASKRLDASMDLMVDENDFDPENPEKPGFDIELIIKQRIADRTYDDVIKRKVETVIHDHKPSDSTEGLNFEKSQLGLADVYAKQYEKDIFNQSDEKEKVSAEKDEAKAVFAKLMHKLDCLTNFNFAPRPPVVKKQGGTVKDLPAMKLEEPIPLIVSSSVRANS